MQSGICSFRFVIVVPVLFSLVSGLVQAGPIWESAGPRGGTVQAMAFAPSSPDIMYAVGSAELNSYLTGALVQHKSTDGGNTWKQLAIPTPENASLTDVAVDCSDPSIVYVATETGLWKSTDGGTNWAKLSAAGAEIWAIAAHPTIANLVYAGGASRILRSSNGGGTWSELPAGLSGLSYFWGLRNLVLDPVNPSRLYAVGYNMGIRRTDDGGEHWVSLGLYSQESLAVDPRNPAVIYAGRSKTTDGGANWNPMPVQEGSLDVNALVVDPADSRRIYAGTSSRSLFVSEDCGETWKVAQGGMVTEATSIKTLLAIPGSGTLWAGCVDIGLIRSTDQGRTWHDADEGLPPRGWVQSLAANPYDSRLMYAATDKGLYMSTDGGARWVNSNQGNGMWIYAIGQTVAVNPVNPNIVYFGGYGLEKSRDGGLTWEGGYVGSYQALAIDPIRPNVVYASTLHWGLQRSNDAGSIWTTVMGGSGQSRCVEIDPFDPDIVYADIGKSTDGGTTWTPLFSGQYRPISVLKGSRTEPGVLYAGWDNYELNGMAFSGGMSKSTDRGQTWTELNPPEKAVLCIATDPVRPKVLYYGSYYGVFRSADGGATWTEIDQAHRPGAGFRSLLIDPNNPDYLLAGTDFSGIYRINVTHSASAELLLTSPSGMERIAVGADFTIRWFSKNAPRSVKIEFSKDGGMTYSPITASTENDGEYLWKAPAQPAADCRIRISQVGGSLSDTVDRPFSVVACEYSVDVRSWPYRQDGEEGRLVVTPLSLGGTCGWTAISEADWIIITSGGQGSTDGVVRFLVKPNTGDFPRTGTLLVAGKKISIEQECRPCYQSDFAVTPREMRIPKEGGLYQVLATVSRGNCPWDPRVTQDWIEIKETKESGATAIVTFTISTNSGWSRYGSVSVGGQPVQIYQAGCDQPELTYTYLLPYLKMGFDAVSNQGFLTGIAFSNCLETPASGLVTAYDLQGSTLKVPFNPNEFGVAPKTPLARQASELFSDSSSELREGWLDMRANQRLGVFFMFGNPEQMDGSLAIARQSRKLYFTRVSEGGAAFRGKAATTEIVVANPNSEPIDIRMTLFGCPGSEACAEIGRTIAPHAVIKGTVAELFARPEISGGYVTVDVTQGPGAIGFELMHLPAQKALVGLNAVSPDASQVLYSAQLATIPGIFTDIKLVNTAAVDRKLALEAIDAQGKRVSTPFAVTLSPGQSLERDAAVLFPVGTAGFVGTLRVTVDGTGVIGDVVFGDPELRFASGLLMQTAAFTEGIFGHVAQGQSGGDGLFTGLALYNPSDQPANVNIQVFGGYDIKVGERDLELGPGCRTAKLINELMPSVNQQIGGYILVSSDRPIIAQELFSNGRFLSAVPPTQLNPAP